MRCIQFNLYISIYIEKHLSTIIIEELAVTVNILMVMCETVIDNSIKNEQLFP